MNSTTQRIKIMAKKMMNTKTNMIVEKDQRVIHDPGHVLGKNNWHCIGIFI